MSENITDFTLAKFKVAKLPQHLAIIMDGNGRWAKQRLLPRMAGHREGLKTVRRMVKNCSELGITALTLFAFSSENWRRPPQEVNGLLKLFIAALQNEIKKLHENNVQLRIIGDRTRFNAELNARITAAEALTRTNTGLILTIAADYGGRWDIVNATQQIAQRVAAGTLAAADITAETLAACMQLTDLPEPDLLIRTSGEWRISNFLLWQLAYTELYFTETLWPDFDAAALRAALTFYAGRERRFGAIAPTPLDRVTHA